jgi:hypothetical protein
MVLEWIKVYMVCQSLVAFVALQQVFDPPAWCGAMLTMCAGDVETLSLGGEAL